MRWSLTLKIYFTVLKLAQTTMKITSCMIPEVFGHMMSFTMAQKMYMFNEKVSEEGTLETTGKHDYEMHSVNAI